jgi:NADH dehydrogenase
MMDDRSMNRLVTVFGGGGFLGRYVAEELLRSGARVRFAERDPRRVWGRRQLGSLGQTQFISADITKPQTVSRAVDGATAVINLVGILKGNFEALHVAGAATIARAAARAGAEALVHVSAIGADSDAASAYGRSKGEGEAQVKAAFPQATIVRPSILFGPEDDFVNKFARMIAMLPVVPVIRGAVRFQPAYVTDVARVIVLAALDPSAHGGSIYELGGPDIMTMEELHRRIAQTMGRDPLLIPVPDAMADLGVRLGGWMPGAPITRDQWLMLQKDNVVSPGAAGFDAFEITPTPLDAVAESWLVQYRRHGRFGLASRAA